MISLFPYQIDGAKWLSGKRVAYLADEMGLGKSAQAIEACNLIGASTVLIICRAIGRENWRNEFKKFGKKIFELTVTSYEGLQKILDLGINYDVAIVDEAHYIKEPSAARTNAVIGIRGAIHRAKRTFFLSGTPTPNHIGELWPILYVSRQTPFDYTKFIDHYCRTRHTGFGVQIIGNHRERAFELVKHIRDGPNSFILRRTKKEVNLQLPPIMYQDVIVSPGQVKIAHCRVFAKWLYPTDRQDELAQVLEEQIGIIGGIFKGGFTDEAMEGLKARAKSISTLRMWTGLQKVQPVIELVSAELKAKAYEKIVLFTWHKDVSNALFFALKKPFGATTVYGGTDPEKLEIRVNAFNKSRANRVLIANIQTAGTSINLTAANQAMFVESSFVPADIHQAAARCHRIGQTKPVTVRFVSLANSLDQRINEILRRKTVEISELYGEAEQVRTLDKISIIKPSTNLLE